MLKFVPHALTGDYSGSYRTEDVKFSPSGRRLAVAATENCMLIYSVDVHARPIQVEQEFELRSPTLSTPHGVDFLSEDALVVANRNAGLDFYRIPAVNEKGASCVIEPMHQAHSPWFGPSGFRRKLRGRDLFCGPGSVRFSKGLLFVSCNYGNTLSTHFCELTPEGVRLQDDAIVAHEGLEILDGVALSRDGRWLALSDHDHHRIVMYRRTDSTPDGGRAKARFARAGTLQDADLLFPHGVCFAPDGKTVYGVDAGSPHLYTFATDDDWNASASACTFKLSAVDDATFIKTRADVPEPFRALEGGAKGIDCDPTGRVLVVTCNNQPLRFFERQSLESRNDLQGSG